MRWRFYLIDRDDVQTLVEEPIGWDAFTIKIKRHAERHGTFREMQGNQFRFYGEAQSLLRQEYELYGVRGQYRMRIDGKCDGGWEEAYLGKVGFDGYKFSCDNGCYVTVDLDQLGPVVDFINRFDQKVDMSSSVAFDGDTSLAAYTHLQKQILLPSKAILLRSIAKNDASQEYVISDDSGWYSGSSSIANTGSLNGQTNIPFNKVEVNSIQDFETSPIIDFYNNSHLAEYTPEIIYNKPEQDLNCTGTSFDIQFRIKGRIKLLASGTGDSHAQLVLKKGTGTFNNPGTGFALIYQTSMYNNPTNTVGTYEFDLSHTVTVVLAPGEKLWLNPFITFFKSTTATYDFRIEFDQETFFNASVISKCDPSTARYYLINEACSRVIESITNNALRLNSDFYGRTDSQPYSKSSLGCGALKAISTGMDIRKAKLANGGEPKMFLSMEDIFSSLSSIDNIGIGVDGDDIRMEPWTYFYKDDIVFYARHVAKLDKEIAIGEHYSTFATGYDKWEAEDYNGLDEFLTKRNYRTALSEVKNELSKLCKWIASGYAHEVTRRRQNDSKDWRYDNDTFVLCLMDRIETSAAFTAVTDSFNIIWPQQPFFIGDSIEISGTVSNNGTFTVLNVVPILDSFQVYITGSFVNETAPNAVFRNLTTGIYFTEIGNINSPGLILDPDTVYNFRISPARNAMRWFNRIAACYRNITSADKLIFMSGDGNFLANGELDDNTGCKLEGLLGALNENQDINTTLFEDIDNALPINYAERVKFTYPMSVSEFNAVKAAPEGLIYYQCESEVGYGWIDELEYSPESGSAKFNLIPKV